MSYNKLPVNMASSCSKLSFILKVFSIISGVDFMTCLLTLSIIIISSLVTKPLAASIPSATRTENQILLSFSIRVLRVALIN